MGAVTRTADPYRDLAIIDARAPRTNQAVIGTLALVAYLADWPWLVGLLVLQLAVGLTFGRRFCLPCVLYFEVLQPRLGEGRLEDARPPRFANVVGVAFLGAATLAFVLGAATVGWALALIVAALALLAATTGLCVGCEAYLWIARMRGLAAGGRPRASSGTLDRVQPRDFGLEPDAGGHALLLFTSPYCLACAHWREALDTRGIPYLRFDVSVHGGLANRYDVRSTPLVLAVALGDGTVLARYVDEPTDRDVDRVASLVGVVQAA